MSADLAPQTRVKLHEFLSTGQEFRLGELPTEAPHPETMNLSFLVKNDLASAISTLKEVDQEALRVVRQKLDVVYEVATAIRKTFEDGGRLFLCGCGATGRLSLSLETFWRRANPESQQVLSFMAGGDIALVKSVEKFEDYPEYGAQQLRSLGFRSGDLLIASTEGGETPFVIGATLEATKTTQNAPYFLYCNPEDMLKSKIKRSREVLEHPQVHSINLFVGPMALAGSTRMQASTALMLFIGLALIKVQNPHEDLATLLDQYYRYLDQLDYSPLVSFIEKESEIYLKKNDLIYEVAEEWALTVFTDTTERSPTFSLPPFENLYDEPVIPSLCYLSITGAKNGGDSWHRLLARGPRPLDPKKFPGKVGAEYLKGFDFSLKVSKARQKLLPQKKQFTFRIAQKEKRLCWNLDGVEWSFPLYPENFFLNHITLKLLLNIHSTLLMGRLGRYEGNLMTWVRPNNYKLIDRVIRYVDCLLQRENKHFSYEEIATATFQEMEQLQGDEPIVLKTVERLKSSSQAF